MKYLAAASGILLLGACAPATPAMAKDEIAELYRFGNNAYSPYGPITLFNRQLFGTTSSGGSKTCGGNYGCGTVFQLSPGAGGRKWSSQTLYSFTGGGDGSYPYAPLTIAPDGDIYSYTSSSTPGTIFRLVPPVQKGGAWTFQTLYTFKNATDGNLQGVSAQLILQGSRLYGIASGGSSACTNFGCGSLFRLDPPAPGQTEWRLVTLHAFTGGRDTGQPNSLTGPDASGALYVSTANGRGAAVQLAPAHGHQDHWDAHVIATFHADPRGYENPAGLKLAPNGTIYAISVNHGGSFVSITPPSAGQGRWTIAELARIVSFGIFPPSDLELGPSGTLLGATYGDQDFGFGNAFQLSPPANGKGAWTYKLLWNFNRGPDQNPVNVIAGENRDVFGVLSGGGYGNGSVFELTP